MRRRMLYICGRIILFRYIAGKATLDLSHPLAVAGIEAQQRASKYYEDHIRYGDQKASEA